MLLRQFMLQHAKTLRPLAASLLMGAALISFAALLNALFVANF